MVFEFPLGNSRDFSSFHVFQPLENFLCVRRATAANSADGKVSVLSHEGVLMNYLSEFRFVLSWFHIYPVYCPLLFVFVC